ncbi:MAG TPA: T9SS type A sorting domain-containing protein [Saprospiraceae bacterium]|nr:T9SS type A sorting domain-containing protein [Saprospiraceae bacterium]
MTKCSLSVFTVFFGFISLLSAQIPDAKRDYQWLIGYNDSVPKTVINLFNFNNQPFKILPFRVKEGIIQSHAYTSVCDKNGQLLLYATGCDIVSRNGEVITNGQHITPDNWLWDGGYCPDYYPFQRSLLFLTDPATDTLFYLLSSSYLPTNEWGIICNGLYASRMSAARVYDRNVLVCADTIYDGQLTACRHANGRDWWVVINKTNTNRYFIYLLDPTGFRLWRTQDIGLAASWRGSGSGQAVFSPDGTMYLRHCYDVDLLVFDFDRCAGELSNARQANIDFNDEFVLSQGLAVSPNSRYAYFTGGKYCHQIDLRAVDMQSSVTRIAVWDGTLTDTWWPTYFAQAALAPDGKIYISCPGGNEVMHVIHAPDAKGEGCKFHQHSLSLPYSRNTDATPNLPYYRLGRLMGSPCDTVYSGPEPDVHVEVEVWPNPTWGDVNIRIGGGLYGGYMDIYNSLGQFLLQSHLVDGYNQIDLTYLPASMYFYTIRDAGGRILKGGKIDKAP